MFLSSSPCIFFILPWGFLLTFSCAEVGPGVGLFLGSRVGGVCGRAGKILSSLDVSCQEVSSFPSQYHLHAPPRPSYTSHLPSTSGKADPLNRPSVCCIPLPLEFNLPSLHTGDVLSGLSAELKPRSPAPQSETCLVHDRAQVSKATPRSRSACQIPGAFLFLERCRQTARFSSAPSHLLSSQRALG